MRLQWRDEDLGSGRSVDVEVSRLASSARAENPVKTAQRAMAASDSGRDFRIGRFLSLRGLGTSLPEAGWPVGGSRQIFRISLIGRGSGFTKKSEFRRISNGGSRI
jgi:hypothetical protein